MTREQVQSLVIGAVIATVSGFAISRTAADPDLWGHVRFGQDIVAGWAIPETDAYSFASDQPWINHEWLAEVLMALAYSGGGGVGLILMKWMLAAGTFGVVWQALKRAEVYTPVRGGLMLCAAVGVSSLLVAVRPQLFSLLLFAVQLALMNGMANGRRRLAYWMPVVFALWANLHGGWIVGVGTLGLWALGGAIAASAGTRWAVAALLLACVGSLANPYGFHLWGFLWSTVGLGRPDIADWQPVLATSGNVAPWLLTTAFVAAAAALRRPPMVRLAVVAALGVLSFRVVRLGGFYALAAVVLLAPSFRGVGPRLLQRSRRPTRPELAVLAAASLVLLGTGVATAWRGITCIAIEDSTVSGSWAPEAEAVTFLRENAIKGRMLTWFDYGELAIWHLAPAVRVSYDGRRETVYSSRVREDHGRFYSSRTDAAYARHLDADLAWLPARLPVVRALVNDGWVRIFDGGVSVVLSRRPATYIEAPPWTGPRCFPGP